MTEQRPERTFQALLAHEPREVPVLAARHLEQGAVGAPGVAVERPPRQREEVGLAVREATAQRGTRLLHRDRMAKKAGQAREEPGPCGEVVEHGRHGARWYTEIPHRGAPRTGHRDRACRAPRVRLT